MCHVFAISYILIYDVLFYSYAVYFFKADVYEYFIIRFHRESMIYDLLTLSTPSLYVLELALDALSSSAIRR